MSSPKRRNRQQEGDGDAEELNATMYLIDQIVATDLARSDQKEKLRVTPKSGTSGVVMKQRPPPPSSKRQQQQKSRGSQHDAMLEEKRKERETRRTVLQQRNRESDTGSTPLPSQQRYSTQDEKRRSVGGTRLGKQQKQIHDRTKEDAHIKQGAKAPSMAEAIPRKMQPLPTIRKLKTEDRFQQQGPSMALAVPQHGKKQVGPMNHRAPSRADEQERIKQRAKLPSMAEAIPQQPYRMRRGGAGESTPTGGFIQPHNYEIAKHRPTIGLQENHQQTAGVNASPSSSKRDSLQQRSHVSPMKQQLSERTKGSMNSEGSNTSLLDEIIKNRERASAIACAIRGQPNTARKNQQRTRSDEEKQQQKAKLQGGANSRRPNVLSSTKENVKASSKDNKDPKSSVRLPISSFEFSTAEAGDDENTTLSAMDDENSDDAAYALAMARSSMRQRLEKEKQQPGAGGAAVAIPHAPSAGKSSRPSLAPAVDLNTKNRATAEASDASADDEEDETNMEAHAGIPLVLPGAFAVQGPDQRDSHSESSSGRSYASQSVEYCTPPTALANNDDQELPSFSPGAMLEAEVCEHYVGHELQSSSTSSDAKATARFRCMQVSACFLFLFGVAASIWIGLSWRMPSAREVTKPSIEGWLELNSHPEGLVDEQRAFFGSDIAVSAEGDLVVVAVPGLDLGEEFNVGQVQIFRERITRDVGTKWESLGVLEGPGASSSEATSLAMTQDGHTIAVGHPFNRERSQVLVYEETTHGEWEQQIDPLYGGSNSSWFGHSLSMSADGSVLAIGAPLEETSEGASSGAVYLLRRATNDLWLNSLAQQIPGSAKNEYFGWSLDVSNDGKYVAVGAPVSDDTTGRVRVYWWDGITWVQVGSDLVGDTALNRFGESVSLSTDGSVLAVGARGTAIDPGIVAIYRLSNDGEWIRDSATIAGQDIGESFGSSLSLSGNGSVLAVGGPRSSMFGEESGVVRVYRWVDETWIQDGSSIGLDQMLSFGSSIALSKQGKRILIGAPRATHDSSIQQAGAVRVFDRDSSA